MMQGCGNEIFSIFNRFHRLKISSILPGSHPWKWEP